MTTQNIDTSERDAMARKPTPAELAALAKEPATMAWVLQNLSDHNDGCWAKHWIRGFRYRLAFAFGFACALQIGGFMFLRMWVRDLDNRTAQTVRTTIEQVLREHKLITETEGFRQFVALGAP